MCGLFVMLFICAYLLSGTRQRGKRDDDVWPEKALNCWMFECKPACAIQLDLPFSSIELLRVYLIGLFRTFFNMFLCRNMGAYFYTSSAKDVVP